MSDPTIGDEVMSSEREEAIEDLLSLCARWLLDDADPQRFIARLAVEGPALFPELFDQEDPSDGDPAVLRSRFFRSFGWAVASAMPLPAQGYRPHKLPLPGRNEPCVCGSLRKFKHCCSPLFEQLPPLEPEGLGALMLCQMPPARWADLPSSGVAPAMVLAAAAELHDDGRVKDACRLLEPWAAVPAPWRAALGELLDLLCDLYLDLDKPRKRKQLAQAMVERGDAAVQSLGWQRLSMIAADAGDAVASRQAFERAQRLTPDDPRLAILEVTTLWGTGQAAQAQERAAFHARRLARLPHAAELADSVELLEAMAKGELPALPEDVFHNEGDDELGVLLDPASPLQQLGRWADRLPPPVLRLDLSGATPQDLGSLVPATSSDKALLKWRKAFKLRVPQGVGQHIDGDPLHVFVNETWSDLLQREPRLADHFEVLDGLLLALDVVPLGMAAGVQAALLSRALDLWTMLRAAWPSARCEWVHLANRPALRLLARRIDIDESPLAEETLAWLQAMVEVLNPHDNHGLRERLAAVYLRRGMAAQALALCERYPSDYVGMQLLQARALLALQRLPEATVAYSQALKANRHVGKLLQAARKPSLPNVPSYAVGSLEKARVAVHPQHDLWRRDKTVQAWVKCQTTELPEVGATLPMFDGPPR